MTPTQIGDALIDSAIEEARKIPSLEKGKEFAANKFKGFSNAFDYAETTTADNPDVHDDVQGPGDVKHFPHQFANPEHKERVELVAKMQDHLDRVGKASPEFHAQLDYHRDKIARGVEKSISRRLRKRQAFPGQAFDPYRYDTVVALEVGDQNDGSARSIPVVSLSRRLAAQLNTASDAGDPNSAPSTHPNRPVPSKYEPTDPLHDLVDHGYSGATPSGWGELQAAATTRALVPPGVYDGRPISPFPREKTNLIGRPMRQGVQDLTMNPEENLFRRERQERGEIASPGRPSDYSEKDLIQQARTLGSRHRAARRAQQAKQRR
jgi:hypothetical protein